MDPYTVFTTFVEDFNTKHEPMLAGQLLCAVAFDYGALEARHEQMLVYLSECEAGINQARYQAACDHSAGYSIRGSGYSYHQACRTCGKVKE